MKYFITLAKSVFSLEPTLIESTTYPQYGHKYVDDSKLNKITTVEQKLISDLLKDSTKELTELASTGKNGFILSSGNTKWTGNIPSYVTKPDESMHNYAIPALSMTNIYAGRLANSIGFNDMTSTDSTACISGHKAIMDAVLYMKYEGMDKMAIISAENGCSGEHIDFFGKPGITLTKKEYEEGTRTNPFSNESFGFLLGQGANILVLESEESLLKTGSTPLAEIVASTIQGEPLNDPMKQNPTGCGFKRVLGSIMNKTDIALETIEIVKTHGTGTKSNNDVEGNFVKEFLPQAEIKYYKHITGHCLGSSCNIEIDLLIKEKRKDALALCLSAGMGNVFGGVLLKLL